MGIYINKTQNGMMGHSIKEKCDALFDAGAKYMGVIPVSYEPNMICVVNNGPFAAAAYLYSEQEYKVFTDPNDTRPKAFFIWDRVEEFAS